MNDDAKKTIEAVTPPPRVRDSSAESTRWTRPTIHEWNCVQGTKSGDEDNNTEDSHQNNSLAGS